MVIFMIDKILENSTAAEIQELFDRLFLRVESKEKKVGKGHQNGFSVTSF